MNARRDAGASISVEARLSQQAALGERDDLAESDDEVIEDTHVDQRECAFQGLGQVFVGA